MGKIILIIIVVAIIGAIIGFFSSGKSEGAAEGAVGGAIFAGGCIFQLLLYGFMIVLALMFLGWLFG